MQTPYILAASFAALMIFPRVSHAQEASLALPEQQSIPQDATGPPQKQKTERQGHARSERLRKVPCPGSFPTDVTIGDCNFTPGMRMQNYVTGSLTDQAMGGAAFYGLMAEALQTPSEWHRTWEGYGLRVGVRYNQAVAKGSAQFLAGLIMHDDPRHFSYANDPKHYVKYLQAATAQPSAVSSNSPVPHLAWKRVWHAIFDSMTVRHSSGDGLGCRLPAISRFAGDFGSAYGGYAWYRGPENTFVKAGRRALGSVGSDLISSFYTEYKPEIFQLFKRKKNNQPSR